MDAQPFALPINVRHVYKCLKIMIKHSLKKAAKNQQKYRKHSYSDL